MQVIDYAKELTQGLSSEQRMQLLCGLGILVLGVVVIRGLIKAGKMVISLVLITALLGYSGFSWFNIAVVTEEAMCKLVPREIAGTAIELKPSEIREGLIDAFVDESSGPLEKFKNTRLALLLADTIERSVEKYDGQFVLSFGGYDVEVYSETIRIVSKVTEEEVFE